MDKIIPNKIYVFKKDFDTKNDINPLRYYAKKGEEVIFEGKSLYAHFRTIKDSRLILLSNKKAFKLLKEKTKEE